jgi:hypothetical protein
MKKIRIVHDEYWKYLEENGIQVGSPQALFGCCLITGSAIVTMDESYLSNMKYKEEIYIIEMFNGDKRAVKRKDVYQDIMWQRKRHSLTSYEIINLTVSNNNKTSIKQNYSYDNYNPSATRIARYLRDGEYRDEAERFRYICSGDLDIAQTNMTTEQMNNIIAKCNITGALWLQVDYNTIAVALNPYQVKIYTKQQKVTDQATRR